MALLWIVHEIDGERRIFIQEAGAFIFARLKAAIAGFDDGEFVEAHMLDAKTARNVPKKMIGRVCRPARSARYWTACLDGGPAERSDRRPAFRPGEAAGGLFRVRDYRDIGARSGAWTSSTADFFVALKAASMTSVSGVDAG